MNSIIELDQVSKSFGPKQVLKDVSFSIQQHEVVGLIGENGAGKSSLLKILAGVHQHDAGTLTIHGQSQKLKNSGHAAKLGIGVVHQEQSLLTNLSIAENLRLGSAEKAGQDDTSRFGFLRWRRINAVARQMLLNVGINLDPRTMVGDLSFAQRQMIEIARAVNVGNQATQAPLIILDEPTSVLEPAEIEALGREIERLKQFASVVFVSHRLDEILRFTDRILVLRHGELVAERNSAEAVPAELFALMTGRVEGLEQPRIRSAGDAPVLLDLQGVGTKTGLNDVSLQVRSGRISCLVGTTSAGGEEILRTGFGIVPTTAGSIHFDGQRLGTAGISRNIQRGMAYLPSERGAEGLVPGMNVAQNMALAHPQLTHERGVLSAVKMRTQTQDWIARLDVRPTSPTAMISDLSGGNQQKVALAKWLCDEEVRLLLLDRPLRGLDPGAIQIVRQQIQAAAERGVAVLLVADTLEEAIELADEIIVMKDGQVSAQFDNINERPSVVQLLEKMV